MNIFRTIATKAPRNRGKVDHVITESPPEQAPPVQCAPPPAGDGSTKADDMLRFMAERRNRLKKT